MASNTSLSKEDISRYGRQLILPEWGVKGQLALKSTSVLVVGVGGLGCPLATYLAAAGVGVLGLLDYDDVEVNNLHRQILHREERLGSTKTESAKTSLGCLNSSVKCHTHRTLLTSENAMDIIKEYDIIADCSDNVATRYLLNDTCVLLGKPLVSGSALRFEGQLTVYNYEGGPCYRCMYPTPPPPHTVTNCSDGGVIGAVPGMIGTLQALEVMKIAAKFGETFSQRMLLFDGLMGVTRIIKLRPRQPTCAVCGDNPTITRLIDYELFCGSKASDKSQSLHLLDSEQRISCQHYKAVLDSGHAHLLIDVREPVEYEICCLDNATNIPISQLQNPQNAESALQRLSDEATQLSSRLKPKDSLPIYVICHHGNDSQKAVEILREHFSSSNNHFVIKDIISGLSGWSRSVDTEFPELLLLLERDL